MTQKPQRGAKGSRFAMMARRPGGPSMESAIAAADRAIEEMKPRYLSWAAADLQELERLIAGLPPDGAAALSILPRIYAKAAQIRDLGATFGFELTTEVADRLCELLHRLQHAGIYSALAVRTHLSALQLVCTEMYRGKSARDEAALLGGLSQVIAKFPIVSSQSEPHDLQ
jgi:hypothetical protein